MNTLSITNNRSNIAQSVKEIISEYNFENKMVSLKRFYRNTINSLQGLDLK